MPRKSESLPGPSPKKRRIEESNELAMIAREYESDHGHPYGSDPKSDMPLDIETVDQQEHHEELVEQEHANGELTETLEDQRLSEALGFPVNKKVNRGRKRLPLPENPDGTRQRYYDRYKNQEYVKRNDVFKYCQVCKKKVFGRLRSLPSEHRLRRMWILRLNLDMERSAELWSREAFSDATHCGEICAIHFPVGTENCKNRELLPIDNRPDADRFRDQQEDENFDFESLELDCVFCDAKGQLRSMIPFIRTRSRRYKWINALTGELDNNAKSILQDRLKNGDSKFLCDWHFSDEDFDINQYGEWKLRKDALPNPNLTEEDKKSRRIYMVNHGDTILARSIDGRRREEILFSRKDYRFLAQKARQTTYANYYGDFGQYQYEGQEVEEEEECEPPEDSLAQYTVDPPLVERPELMAGPSRLTSDPDPEFSDDSDEENDIVGKVASGSKINIQETRICCLCNRIVSSHKSMKEFHPRTWPYDEAKHLKWLEFMNLPRPTENSLMDHWRKRRHALLNQDYHYTPMNICQDHLDCKQVYEKYEEWLTTYCVLCDQDLGDPNLLLPFPRDRRERLLWLGQLVSIPTVNKANDKRWKWLKSRLTREKPTRYRLCVYHFKSDAFVEKDDCVEFNDASLPIPLGLPEYDLTPRGIWGVIKCPLCDEWAEHTELVDIRPPTAQYERILLVEMLTGDKTLIKKGVEQLCLHPCRICRHHIPPDIMDPYSVIAERKLVCHTEIQCVQCDHKDLGSNMVPVPFNLEQRKYWVEALGRDHVTRSRLINRLNMDGRHYLCTVHFHKSSIRYIPSLGIWKKFGFLPLGVTSIEREKYLNREDVPYSSVIIQDIDDHGIVQELNYDDVLAFLGEMPQELSYSEHEFTRAGGSNQPMKKMPKEKTEELSEPSEGPPVLEPAVQHDESSDSHRRYVMEEEEIVDDLTDEHVIVDEHIQDESLVHEEDLPDSVLEEHPEEGDEGHLNNYGEGAQSNEHDSQIQYYDQQ